MGMFVMEIAGLTVRVEPLYMSTKEYCRAYLCDQESELFVCVTEIDLAREQELLDIEAVEEGLKKRKFGEPFLERAVIQRRVAEALLEKDVLMMHGSTVAVDGQAYLFTAPCGTGKSTHTRLWREVFGERAVMVNDDKPFLRFQDGKVLACGSPWSGKHGLGSNVCFPLKGICILRRGPENEIRPAVGDGVSDFLLHQIFRHEGDVRVPVLLEELMGRVPVWEMACNKDREAAFVSHGAMSSAE